MSDYNDWYTKGWQAAQRSADLETAEARFLDRTGEPWNGAAHNAFENGWLDWAAGREKFHLRDCPDHEACGRVPSKFIESGLERVADKPTCEGMGAPLTNPDA